MNRAPERQGRPRRHRAHEHAQRPLHGLADLAHEIPRIIDEDGTDRSRRTVGKVELKPGAPHTIPGEAVFTLVGRDSDEAVMEALGNSCRKSLSAIARRDKLMFEYEQVIWLKPTACSSRRRAARAPGRPANPTWRIRG